MSLKPCKECGHEVAASAETCPNCGVKKPAPSSAASALIWPVIIVIAIAAVVAMQKDGDEKTDAQQTDTAPSQPQSVRDTPEEPASPWQVTSYRSPVDDSTNVHANITYKCPQLAATEPHGMSSSPTIFKRAVSPIYGYIIAII